MENCLTNEQYQTLYKQYSQSHRKYHNWNHITSILNRVKSTGIVLSVPQYLAILYHDCVYEIGKIDNEERSAQFLLDNVKMSEAEVAAKMILASAYHTYDQDIDDETQLFLDLDLHELSTDAYLDNTKAIRKEYKSYSPDKWVDSRIIFLSAMLSRNKIFYTEFFDEQRARFNMNLEVTSLLFSRNYE